jgi:uncharacterized DUF497 family protein
MAFEWDEEKSRKTMRERGLDFKEAAKLWDDLDSIEVLAFSDKESRWAKIGTLNGQLHTAIFTLRGKKVRIISVRRAHPKEIAFYEQN